MQVWSLSQKNPLEKEMATHSSILAWWIPRTEEPDGAPTVPGVAELDTTVTNTFTFYGLTVHLICAAAAAKSLPSCLTVQPQRRQPTRPPCPWDSQAKNTGVGCHCLLHTLCGNIFNLFCWKKAQIFKAWNFSPSAFSWDLDILLRLWA